MSNAKTVIIASNNAHKAEEIAHALDFPGWEFRTLKEAHIASDPAEDADTFLGNARIKAKAAWEAAKETLGHPVPVLADDSGLEVDALGGAPGVYSARYSGEGATDGKNNAKLLKALENVPDDKRTARFRTVITCEFPDGCEIVVDGVCEGRILREPRGADGFGYDPLFYYEPFGKTFAELSPEEKNQVSHRGRAMKKFAEEIGKYIHLTK